MDSAWNSRSSYTTYRFVRVSRLTGEELGTIPVLKGGHIERNNDVRVFERASADVVGELDLGRDLVRIYMTQGWPDGTVRDVALGTFIPSRPRRDVHGRYSTSELSMTGRLQELYDDGFASPVTLEKGTNAVEAARSVVEQMGLTVISDPSDFTTTRTRTYGIGVKEREGDEEVSETKLDMVNNLLGLAGFFAARTDPMGRVVFRKNEALSERPVTWEFSEGPAAKFLQDMTDERDSSGVANHVVVVYSGDDERMVGEAWDNDPASEFSTVSVGRTITKSYTYSELPDGGQAVADSTARKYLAQNQSVIHRVTMSCVYAPVSNGDAVTLRYGTGGVSGKFEIRVNNLQLVPGCLMELELRNWER